MRTSPFDPLARKGNGEKSNMQLLATRIRARRRPSFPLDRGIARRGGLAAIMIVALVLAIGFMSGAIHQMTLLNQQSRLRQQRVQREWIVDGALKRVEAQLESDPKYRGETWVIPPEVLGDLSEAKVIVQCQPTSHRSLRRFEVRVACFFPNRDHQNSKTEITKELTIHQDPTF